MTINELLAAVGLTANDVIPMWDAEATGSEEPTKKITASNFVAGMIALGNLLTTGDVVDNLSNGSTNPVSSGGMYNLFRTFDISDRFKVASKYSGWIFQATKSGCTVSIMLGSNSVQINDDDIVLSIKPEYIDNTVPLFTQSIAVFRAGLVPGALVFNANGYCWKVWIAQSTTARLITCITYTCNQFG